MQRIIKFENLSNAELIVDCLYQGGCKGNTSDDPISKILNCGNQGGFRYSGNAKSAKYVVLYSSLHNIDWPDFIDFRTGIFTYYGDNKKPGHLIHDTPKKGNQILSDCFSLLETGNRVKIPPFFVFTKANTSRDVIFRGLAVPGGIGLNSSSNLIALWKSQNSQRFQNYRALFTILDTPIVERKWIDDLDLGNRLTENAPSNYTSWVKSGKYDPLIAERSVRYRTKEEQQPNNEYDRVMLQEIVNFFNDPYKFEACAAEIAKLMDPNILSIDLTRPWLDGGRDGIGKYRIGTKENAIEVDFAIEAKRYALNNCISVKHTSRLISRIRNRQFGILITTSYLHHQAYKEIVDDQHPVVIISGVDIIEILKQNGINTLELVRNWLNSITNDLII